MAIYRPVRSYGLGYEYRYFTVLYKLTFFATFFGCVFALLTVPTPGCSGLIEQPFTKSFVF